MIYPLNLRQNNMVKMHFKVLGTHKAIGTINDVFINKSYPNDLISTLKNRCLRSVCDYF